jgi:PKD repeat protein
MVERVSSLDQGYTSGDLSLFPDTADDRESLYEAKNNAETTLKQALPFGASIVIVEDASGFPEKGLIRVGPAAGEPGEAELIYYDSRTNTVFKELVRGFAGSTRYKWPSGTYVTSSVMAEHHNAIKDALLNIETKVGTSESPAAASLAKELYDLEVKYLAPKAAFRCYPRKGVPPCTVTFKSLSEGDVVRYLWDFGDGSYSIEKNPTHTYQNEGTYTVKLNVITSQGGQGVTTKRNYIDIDEGNTSAFFYVIQEDTSLPAYSTETAQGLVLSGENPSAEAATFNFVDQTDGDILQRYWVFGDGETEAVEDPNIHMTTHVYAEPGEYEPTLIIVFSDEKLRRAFLNESITVI